MERNILINSATSVIEEQLNLRVIAFREGNYYIAQCLDYDIVAQDKSLPSVVSRFMNIVKAEVLGDYELVRIPKPPHYYESLWNQSDLKLEKMNINIPKPFSTVEIKYSEAA